MLVGPPVERSVLAAAGGGQPGDPDPPVTAAGLDPDQPGGLERAQQPAQIAGIEPQARAQLTHLATIEPDLPQQPGFAERPVATEEAVAERPNAFGHYSVEPADLLDSRVRHSLTLVSKPPGVNLDRAVPITCPERRPASHGSL